MVPRKIEALINETKVVNTNPLHEIKKFKNKLVDKEGLYPSLPQSKYLIQVRGLLMFSERLRFPYWMFPPGLDSEHQPHLHNFLLAVFTC